MPASSSTPVTNGKISSTSLEFRKRPKEVDVLVRDGLDLESRKLVRYHLGHARSRDGGVKVLGGAAFQRIFDFRAIVF
jgi:hypothetical protein